MWLNSLFQAKNAHWLEIVWKLIFQMGKNAKCSVKCRFLHCLYYQESFPAQIFCLGGQIFKHELRTEIRILKEVKKNLNSCSRNQAGSFLRAGPHLKLKTQSSYHHEPKKSIIFLLENKSYSPELRISLFFLLSWFKPFYSGTLVVYMVVGKWRKKKPFWAWLWWLKHKIILKFFPYSRNSEGCLSVVFKQKKVIYLSFLNQGTF